MNKAAKYILFALTVALTCHRGIAFAQDYDENLTHLPPLDYLLIQYADSNDLKMVNSLLRQGANANATTIDSITPLMCAVQNGNYYMTCLLLGYNANPNIKPFDGTSALHAAATYGNDSIAVLLLNNKAQINARNNLGLTPLHYSVWNGFPYLTNILIEHGSAIDTTDIYGNTPLALAIYNGTNSCAQILLDYGANPNRADFEGITPLMIAAQFNDTLQISYLIDYGATIAQKDSNGFDALSHAIRAEATDAISMLLRYNTETSGLTKNYNQQASETQNATIKHIIRAHGFRNKVRPSIENVHMGIEAIMGSHNFMWGVNIGITESTTKARLSLHYLYRPNYGTTLENRNMQIYQFKEKRQVLGLNITRNQQLVQRNRRKSYGAYYGIGADLTLRNYIGTQNDPKTKVYLNAKAGLYRRKGNNEIQLGWDYTSLKTIDVTPHRFGINLIINIPNTKSTATIKQIDHVY